MAEEKRFELLDGYKPSPVFKTGAFDHSATPPLWSETHITRFRFCVNNNNKKILLFSNLARTSEKI